MISNKILEKILCLEIFFSKSFHRYHSPAWAIYNPVSVRFTLISYNIFIHYPIFVFLVQPSLPLRLQSWFPFASQLQYSHPEVKRQKARQSAELKTLRLNHFVKIWLQNIFSVLKWEILFQFQLTSHTLLSVLYADTKYKSK